MIDCVQPSECVLCAGCRNVCPTGAISFENQYLDYAYPLIDSEKCIQCNKCEMVCPIVQKTNLKEGDYLHGYAAKVEDDIVRKNSTSGGVFYAIAMHTIQEGGYVCGAVYEEDYRVAHIVSNQKEDIIRMMGSKYAVSEMGDTLQKVKDLLKQQKKVLFTGCPCQIASVCTYLGEKPEGLFLLEIFCHGNCSGEILQSYLKMHETRRGSKIKDLAFREKSTGWHTSRVRIEFEDATQYKELITIDPYMRAFLSGTTMRESCYDCRFRSGKSGCDLMIGDFWGAEVEVKEMDDNKGLSAVVVVTPQGEKVLGRLQLALREVDVASIIKYNRNVEKSTKKDERREAFYDYAKSHGYANALEEFFKESAKERMSRKGRNFLRNCKRKLKGEEKALY
ncbi:MAG: Coenzyme F420 hydrogenase/dehydrogenase, beta subunit C-terminal domain [Eubacterium sp.]|nr:Coenzyme F420 hydrogenase/dehydrogenase, beta subunit C-terminal domain [Eubacterium sp.]